MKLNFLIIGDNININNISSLLNINPSRIMIKGEKNKNFNVINLENIWQYNIEIDSIDIDDLVLEFFNVFYEKQGDLLEIKNEMMAYFKIEVIAEVKDEITPSLYFNNKIVKFLGKLDCPIDIDLYVV